MKTLLLFLSLVLGMSANGQEKDSLQIFDADWKPTWPENGHFLLHIHQISDTCWQRDYYNYMGPLLRGEQYRDAEGKVPDGAYYHYNDRGKLVSITEYRNGQMVDLPEKRDTAAHHGSETESEYPGGSAAWNKFLRKNVHYPSRAFDAKITGDVQVNFIVDKDGFVKDPFIGRSIEYSIDEEALKVIRKSKRWTPAVQDGKQVKSYKIQSLGFHQQGSDRKPAVPFDVFTPLLFLIRHF